MGRGKGSDGLPKPATAAKESGNTEFSGILFYTCTVLLFVSLIQHAFFPPGRAGPQSPLPALVSTIATDRQYEGPKGDYAATIAALRQEASSSPNVQLLFLGDSITESLRGDCTRPECVEELPAAWAKLFAPHHALALGVSGDRTENLLYRLSHGEVTGLQPALTVVEIGTNNLAFGHSAEATALGIQAVVRSVRELLPKTHVALLLLFPRPKDKGNDTPWNQVDVVNELLWESVRGSPGVSVISCTRPFLKDGLVDLTLLPDGIHPNGAGAEAIAGCLAKQFNRYLD